MRNPSAPSSAADRRARRDEIVFGIFVIIFTLTVELVSLLVWAGDL